MASPSRRRSQSNGSFSTTFTDTAGLGVAGSPYTVSYSYSGDGTFAAASQTSTLTVTPATPTVSVADAADALARPSSPAPRWRGLTASRARASRASACTLSYYAGSTATGTPLSGPPESAGTYTSRPASPLQHRLHLGDGADDLVDRPGHAHDHLGGAGPIVYGTKLGPAQLDATASVPGSFVYTPPRATVLGAGNNQHALGHFHAHRHVDYASATATTSIDVRPGHADDHLGDPADHLRHAARRRAARRHRHRAGQLRLHALGRDGPGRGRQPGRCRSPSRPTMPPTTHRQPPAPRSTCDQATPAITWARRPRSCTGRRWARRSSTPPRSVPGRFAYSPRRGPSWGPAATTLSVTFTPTDTVDYTTATATTTITVEQATPTITWGTPAEIMYGTALGRRSSTRPRACRGPSPTSPPREQSWAPGTTRRCR